MSHYCGIDLHSNNHVGTKRVRLTTVPHNKYESALKAIIPVMSWCLTDHGHEIPKQEWRHTHVGAYPVSH